MIHKAQYSLENRMYQNRFYDLPGGNIQHLAALIESMTLKTKNLRL